MITEHTMKRRLIAALGCLSLIVAACGNTGLATTPTPLASTTSIAPTAGAPVDSGPSTATAQGQLTPKRSVSLGFAISGLVTEVLVTEGQSVEAGQVLAYLGGRENYEAAISAAQKGLIDAQQSLNSLLQNTTTEAANAQVEMVNAKQTVSDTEKALFVLLYPDVSGAEKQVADLQLDYENALTDLQLVQYNQNAQRVQSAKAGYDAAKFAYDRAQAACDAGPCDQAFRDKLYTIFLNADDQLTAANIAHQNEIVNVTAALIEAEIALNQAKANLASLSLPPDPMKVEQAEASLALAQANLTAANTYYEKVKDGPDQEAFISAQASVDNAEASLIAAQAELTKLELRAPFAGTLAELDLQAGQFVLTGQKICQLADFSGWVVETSDVDEYALPSIAMGQPVQVTFVALPDVVLAGHVGFISPLFQTDKEGKTTYMVQIVLDETRPSLHWGMTAFVSFNLNP